MQHDPQNYNDRSMGFYRRLIIIRFDHAVDEANKDPDLISKLREVADGIFLFALEGLKWLIQNNYEFSETESNKTELQQYRESSDSVLSFVSDCCERGKDYEIGSSELYWRYKNYCEDEQFKGSSQRRFVEQLLGSVSGLSRGFDKREQKRTIKGIRLYNESGRVFED